MCSSPLKAAGQAEGRLTLSSPFSIPSLPFFFITSLSCCQLKCLYIFPIPAARWKSDRAKISQSKTNREIDVGLETWASVVWGSDWVRAAALSAWLKPLPGHSSGAALAFECYCIVRALPIPPLLNGFNHWFRFSYTLWLKVSPSYRFGLHGSLGWPV